MSDKQSAGTTEVAKSDKKDIEKLPPAPNIVFVGARRRLNKKTGMIEKRKLSASEIPTFRRDGDASFELPTGSEQLKGFYHADAERIKRAWPRDFKTPVAKGGKA